MSFVGFIKNNQDFCQVVDLLDLVDLKQLTEEEIKSLDDYKVKTGTFNNSKVLHLCKCPIYTKTQNEEYYLNNAISYKLVHNDTLQQFMLADNDKKTIIIDFCKLGYILSSINSTLFFKGNNKIFKTNIDGYEVKSFEFIKETLANFIKERQYDLITKYRDDIYNITKAELTKKELTKANDKDQDSTFINMAKANYLLNRNIEDIKPSLDYLLDKSESTICDNYNYYISLYIRDNNKLLDLIEKEFLDEFKNNFDFNLLNNLKFYSYEKQVEVSNKIKPTFETDEELNILKEILNCLNQAGKTVVINGNKYVNNIISSNYYDKIKLGTGNKTILLSDVKTVMFGKKVLYSAL